MSVIAFSPTEYRLYTTLSGRDTFSYHMAGALGMDRRMSSVNETFPSWTTIRLRKLPRNTTAEAVRTMLLFAKDLKDTEIVSNEYDEDIGFVTAIARFSSLAAATEAQVMLDGKSNTAGQANMIVDVVSGPQLGNAGRRNTIDPSTARKIAQSVSPPLASSQKASRFNGTFQSMEKISPPLVSSPPDQSSSDTSSHLQTIFSPQSPVANIIKDRSRASGKSVIGEDGGDDETGELLKDPLAYFNNGNGSQRKHNNIRMPTAAFSQLSLNTNMNSPSPNNFTSPRGSMSGSNIHGTFSPANTPHSAYHSGGNPYLRHNYPPVNPADQNPPCNTLYVGNLPIDTSEDELKAMFSKQRGYKRLCFRTKQNGPMCFVEFEDISFATKALNELYGVQLHNSVKGGIRLSFSKNPLGVRAGQPGSASSTTPMSAAGPIGVNGIGPMSPGAFSSAAGPPPGLTVPPGLNMSVPSVGTTVPTMNGHFVNQGLGIGNPALGNMRSIPVSGTSTTANNGSMYPDYMMGR